MRTELSRAAVALPLLVGAALAVAGPACRGRTRRTPDDTLVVVMNEPDLTELDPRYAQTSNDQKVSRLIAPGLVAVDQPSLEPRLDLAARVELVDPLTWDVTLREGLRFSDGTPVTAEDVRYTFESVLDPAMGSLYRRSFEERLTRLETVGPLTVRFSLKQQIATFVTDLDFGIVSSRAARAQPRGRWRDGRCVGAGPYRIRSFRQGEAVLERNEHYHGAPPVVPRLVLRTVRDANARLLVLVGGSADLTQNSVRLDLVADLRAKRRLRVETGPSAILSYLMFQNEDRILRDPRVRRAIALAIDRDQIIRTKFGGLARTATGLLPAVHWAYAGDVEHNAFDPDAARRLLDEAGHPDPDGPGGRPRFSLTYKTSADAFRVSVARIIAGQLGRVGIDVEVRAFEFATFFTDVKRGSYQLASMQTSELVEPDMYFPYFHSSRIPSPEQPDLQNRWRYRSAEADRLIVEGRRELDRGRRTAIYADLQRLLARDLPILPLWHEDNVVVLNADVEGFEILPNARLSPLTKVRKRR